MSNAKTSETIDLNTGRAMLTELDRIAKSVEDLRKRVLFALPAKYGSEEWWEKSTAKSLEEYKMGKYMSFSSAKDLIKELNS